MNRIKKFFGSVATTKNSETFAFWGSLVTSALCHLSPAICEGVNSVSMAILNVPANQLIATLFVYAGMRMTSKAVKAEPEPAKP